MEGLHGAVFERARCEADVQGERRDRLHAPGLDLHVRHGLRAGTRDLLDFFQVDVDARGLANIAYTDNLNGPPDGSDPHQELIYFVKQQGGKALFGK